MRKLLVLLLNTLLIFVIAIYGVACGGSGWNRIKTADTTAPIATLSGQPIGTVNYSTADIVVAGANVVSYKYKFDGGSWSAEEPVSTHIILSNLTDGLHSISVVGKDVADNWQIEASSTITSWTVAQAKTPDNLTPIATLSDQPTGTVNYSTADIIVAGTNIISYKYKLDSGSWSAEKSVSTHIILSNLTEGLHTISVISKDAAGNWQTEAMSTTTSWTVNTSTLPTTMVFPDANLEAAIRAATGKSQGVIYQSDLMGLTKLDAFGRGIADLTGIEHCTRLTSLELYNNKISNLSPLSSLTSLTRLGLGSNQISNLSPLSSLTSLTWLDLGSNKIGNLSPLSSLTGLTSLYLNSNQISNLSTLSAFTHLTSLELYSNQINNLSPLSSLTSLTRLGLGSNQISNLSSLSSLTSLTWLDLAGNQINNIEPLVNNPGLGQGDSIYLTNDPLSTTSVNNYIPALKARGVAISY